MSEAILRPAIVDDAPLLAEMRFAFRATLESPVEDREEFVRRCAEWMADRIRGSSWRCWVAEAGGLIQGHVWLMLVEKIPNPVSEPEWHGYVSNLFVVPELRSHGLGRQLVQTAMDYCNEANVDSVILWPTERSKTLYARFGFRSPDDLIEVRQHTATPPSL